MVEEGLDVFWNEAVRPNVPVATVMQGGGIRALAFIGHVRSLQSAKLRRDFVTAAYSGASGGALVAVALWSGLKPERLLQILDERCSRYFGLLFSIFSVWDFLKILLTWMALAVWIPIEKTWWALISIVIYNANNFRILSSHLRGRKVMLLDARRWRPAIDVIPGCTGWKFETFIGEIIAEGLRDRGIHDQLIRTVLGESKPPHKLTFNDLRRVKGFVQLVNKIESADVSDDDIPPAILKDFRKKVNNGNIGYTEEAESGPRNQVLKLIFGVDTAHSPYFAPIYISLCNLDTRQPVGFNNVDPIFGDVPIARIVRASAGYPLVFRPKKIRVNDKTNRYSDGGIISNFPASVLTEEFRDIMDAAVSPTTRGRQVTRVEWDHFFLGLRPLITIGLSTRDMAARQRFLALLINLVTGDAKNQIEQQVASRNPYTRVVVQEMTDHPSILAFHKVKSQYMKDLATEAEGYLDSLNLSHDVNLDGAHRRHIEGEIRRSLESVRRVFGPEGFLRAHLYLFDYARTPVMRKKLFMFPGHVASEEADCEMSFEKPAGGVIGVAIDQQKPIMCKIGDLARKMQASPDETILGLRHNDVRHIRNDLNFCIAVPVYDFFSVRYKAGAARATQPVPGLEDILVSYDTGIGGPLWGVVSIDGYSPTVDLPMPQLNELILKSDLIETLERRMLEIGNLCSYELKRVIKGNG